MPPITVGAMFTAFLILLLSAQSRVVYTLLGPRIPIPAWVMLRGPRGLAWVADGVGGQRISESSETQLRAGRWCSSRPSAAERSQ